MGVIELKPEVFSNPKKGKKIFAALVQILETQQSQLETLADERKRQEERIKVEYERWISGVRSLKGLIDQLRSQTKLSEMARLVEAAKTNLVFGLKMKQELVYKLKLDNSEDELADFKEWFDILCHRCPTEKECPERVGEIGSSKAAITKKLNCRALEKEVKRLKCEYEKLSIKNSSEVSALASEKEFAWNQYREMESKYNTQLQTKNDEVNQVNARVGKLLETVEQLQSSSMEKDAQIAELKASLAKMGAETSKKEGEVSRFLDGSNSLKKSKGGLLTPVLRGCTAGQKAKATSSDEKHGSGNTRFCTVEPKTKALSSDSEHASRKATRSRKRKPFSSQDNRSEKKRVASEEETPKLFTSNFKIPKLKSSSSLREAEGRTSVGAGEKEAHKLLQPQDKTLKEMAIEFAEFQVCVDVFLTTQSYADVASISVVPSTTGGQVYRYFPFSAVSDTAKLFNDLRWNVTRPQGFEAVMRVRCSQGLQVQEYYGNFCKRIPTDVDLPGIDCDKTILVTLKLDDKLQEGSECAFQCALLYTTVYGQRRIRVTNISLPCTSMLTNLFRSADLDAQFACFLKQAIEIPTTPLLQVRDQLTNHCITILHSYRKFCATVSSSGQLILPEALKLFPLYTLALIKSTGLRNDGRVDDRSWWVNYVSSVSVPLVVPLVYPRMISVHDLASKEIDQSVIPIAIPLSSEHISDEGIYLLENGMDALIYVGNSVDPQVVQQLFGASRVDEIPTQLVLQQYDNPLSKRFNEVINEIRRQRCSYLSLKLCKKGDPSALIKSTGLRNDGRVDDRSWWVNYVSSVSVPLVVPLVYPRMISVHDLASKEIDQSVIPIAIPLSSEHISDEGIYLLENGMDALIYVGNSVDPQVVQQLFGASRVDEIPTQLVLQQYDNPLSKRFNEVINEIRRQRCSYLSLKLCKKGDPSGILFFSYMVEDKSSSGLSYVEFLVHVHRQIQSKMN